MENLISFLVWVLYIGIVCLGYRMFSSDSFNKCKHCQWDPKGRSWAFCGQCSRPMISRCQTPNSVKVKP